MELELNRVYHPEGTNGHIQHEGQLVCPSIELPWRENRRSISCIPEGRYELRKRYTQKRGQHLLVVDVPGRSGILIHPANDAQRDLLGCIAPVTTITGPGRGIQSRAANEKLKALVTSALDRKEKVFITIKSKEQ
ncbi:DUF5675 family protein [Parachryseolinea silvisoli]|uniref:DUF5675 family protein n=1 Tax=Parachryseolinea silvisoli TaxID=2873601 RepID=UPI0022658533|nr:DUF5675 family protein [Parachryseolinea silvisoli]MCD9015161.1 DUF5675 family protein [Parachryseolinea silvisoli]